MKILGNGSRRSPVATVGAGLVTCFLVAMCSTGCGRIADLGHQGPRRVAADAALSSQCANVPTVPDDAPLSTHGANVRLTVARVTLAATDGSPVGAAVVGPRDLSSGALKPVGVVLDQGASQTLCDWLPFAARLAKAADARVLVFDRPGSGSSPGNYDLRSEPGLVVTAADWLTAHGSTHLVLLGSSLGTIATVLASSPDGPAAVDGGRPTRALAVAPCATVVVSPHVSAAATAQGAAAATTVSALSAPSTAHAVWLTWEQQNASVAADAAEVAAWATAHGTHPHLHPVSATTDHSIGLVENHPDVQAFLIRAVRSCR